jgi:hypothetical protein
VYSNVVRRFPMMRHPWEHVLGFAIGGYAAGKYVEYGERKEGELNEMLERMGPAAANMRPMQ